METETKANLKLTFIPTHQTNKGVVTGELRTEGGSTICSIEKANAEEIIKRNNMHDELIEVCSAICDNEIGTQTDSGKEIPYSVIQRIQQLLKQAEQK